MTLNSFFERIFCINLASSTDRLAQFSQQAGQAGIHFERFEAVAGAPDGLSIVNAQCKKGSLLLPGEVGCLLSHRAIIAKARSEGWPSVFIFEDDVMIRPDTNQVFADLVGQVPADWDMLYLSGNHFLSMGGVLKPVDPALPVITKANRKEPITGLYRVGGSVGAIGYGVSSRAYDAILEATDPRTVAYQVDVVYAILQKRMQAFVLRPHLVWTPDNISTIRGKTLGFNDITRYG